MCKPELPNLIRKAMSEAKPPIKTVSMLATRCGYGSNRMTVHRVFSGRNQHISFRVCKRLADTLQWSLDELSTVVLGNDPKAVGAFLRARIAGLGLSLAEVGRRVWGFQGNINAVIQGEYQFDHLRVYKNIATALGIKIDELYECVVTENPLTDVSDTDTLSVDGIGISG